MIADLVFDLFMMGWMIWLLPREWRKWQHRVQTREPYDFEYSRDIFLRTLLVALILFCIVGDAMSALQKLAKLLG